MNNGREREIKLLAPPDFEPEVLAARRELAGVALNPSGSRSQQDVYVDTQRLQLLSSGFCLRYRDADGATTVTLKEVSHVAERALVRERAELEVVLKSRDADPCTLPPQPIGEHVASLTAGEPLAPIVRLRTERTTFRLGSPSEAGAELCVDRVEILKTSGEEVVSRFIEVEVEDRGGGTRLLEAAGRELAERYGMSASDLSKLERSLGELGVLAGEHPRPEFPEARLRESDRLVDAAYTTFRKHFYSMLKNEPGTRIGDDTEFLHDMRVSTRRLRAAIQTFRRAFGPKRLEGYNDDLRWIARALGDVRDLDVYLERLPEYASLLPETERGALAPLEETLKKERERARRRLWRVMDSKRYAAFLERFGRFLDRGPPRSPGLPAASENVTRIAPRRIRKALRAVLKQGRSIPSDPPPEELHRLRILCKRLRYTCESFSDLYGKGMRRFIRGVIQLQELLGDHQDVCMAEERLRASADSLASRGRRAAATALVLGQLIAAQREAAADARSRFRKAWKAFDRKKLRRKMFK